VGLLIASVLAANMSTCSAFLVDSGALFTEGLYRRILVPDREDRHYLWVGRVSGFAITLLGVLYAVFLIQSVLYTFLLTETLATFVGIGLLGGIFWRRANRWGALASLLAALTANFFLYARTGQRLDHWDPNVFLAALAAGVAALVVVSLVTPPESAARLESFLGRLQTSSDGDGTSTAQPLLLVNILHPRRAAGGRGWRAFHEDLGGFALGWAIVVTLVVVTGWWLAI
jgi:Na+/proline symporter